MAAGLWAGRCCPALLWDPRAVSSQPSVTPPSCVLGLLLPSRMALCWTRPRGCSCSCSPTPWTGGICQLWSSCWSTRWEAGARVLLRCLKPPPKVPSAGHRSDLLPHGTQWVTTVEAADKTWHLTVVPFLAGDRALDQGAGEVFFELKTPGRGGWGPQAWPRVAGGGLPSSWVAVATSPSLIPVMP